MSIGVVIPVYKQGELAVEAIRSAELAFARSGTDGTIVIVNDGCPFTSTHVTAMAAAAANPSVRYVRTANKGLSAARNVGIDFLLREASSVDAIFFLDGDNRLLSTSIEALERALHQFPDADWFYPDIERFGVEGFDDYTESFDPLTEAFWNICEAGSLVRTSVFRSGVRFDETMRAGFEDWDFWLSCTELGFRGKHLQDSGFLYRMRPESMLKNPSVIEPRSSTTSAASMAGSAIRGRCYVLKQQYAPRYAIFLSDRQEIVLTTDPALCRLRISLNEYAQRLYSLIQMPSNTNAGAFFVTVNSRILHHLEQLGLVHMVFSTLESLTEGAPIATCQIAASTEDRLSISTPANGQDGHVSMMALHRLRSAVEESRDDWIRELANPNITRPILRLDLPSHSLPAAIPALSNSHLVRACLEFRASAERASVRLPKPDKQMGGPDRSLIFREIRGIVDGGVMRPLAKRREYEVAFAVPYFDIGGVERVTTQVASALKEHGIGCHLVLIGEKDIVFAKQTRSIFDSVSVLFGQSFERWGPEEYFGSSLTQWALKGGHENALGLFAAFDAVVLCQCADVAGLTGRLRRLGVVTASHVHVFDVTQNGRLVGHPDLAVAYEHSLDLIATCSPTLSAQLAARGVPREKIVTIENSTGISEDPLRTQDWRQRRVRANGEADRPVCVLYAGRFDEQKGMDRLSDIVRERRSSPAFRFRVVGKSVLQATARDLHGIVLEPAVHTDAELIALLTWADVLLLPSRYEGLPLILIEALATGVVPIVADCGAVREVVRDGENGFVVSQAHCVQELLERLDRLAQNRPLLVSMAGKAIESMRGRSWQESTKEFRNRLCALIDERKLQQNVAAGLGVPAELARPPRDQPIMSSEQLEAIARGECVA